MIVQVASRGLRAVAFWTEVADYSIWQANSRAVTVALLLVVCSPFPLKEPLFTLVYRLGFPKDHRTFPSRHEHNIYGLGQLHAANAILTR